MSKRKKPHKPLQPQPVRLPAAAMSPSAPSKSWWFALLVIALVLAGVALTPYGWLIPVAGGIGAIVALYASKPTARGLAALATAFILLPSLWQAFTAYSESRTKEELRTRACEALAKSAYTFNLHISDLVLRASDGWLPSNDDELFSRRVAKMISSELNVTDPAPVMPQITVGLDRGAKHSLQGRYSKDINRELLGSSAPARSGAAKG